MKPENALRRSKHKYRVVQLYFKPEIGVLYLICSVIVNIEKVLSNSIQNTSFSGVKSSWTTL